MCKSETSVTIISDVRNAVAQAVADGHDVRDVRAAVTGGHVLGGVAQSGVWEQIAPTRCVNKAHGVLIDGENAVQSMRWVSARRSSASTAKAAELCATCVADLFTRAAAGETAYIGTPNGDGVELGIAIYAPGKPWERFKCPNLHGVCYELGCLPSWGTAKAGVYWSATMVNLRHHGNLISLYNTGYNPWVWLTAKGPKGQASLPRARYGGKAALWDAIKSLWASVM